MIMEDMQRRISSSNLQQEKLDAIQVSLRFYRDPFHLKNSRFADNSQCRQCVI